MPMYTIDPEDQSHPDRDIKYLPDPVPLETGFIYIRIKHCRFFLHSRIPDELFFDRIKNGNERGIPGPGEF